MVHLLPEGSLGTHAEHAASYFGGGGMAEEW
jgi:hypothetical protein